MFGFQMVALLVLVAFQAPSHALSSDEQMLEACKQGHAMMMDKMDGIYALGVGSKEIGGIPTGTLAIRFYVHEKLINPDPSVAIPSEVNGCPTDVIVVAPWQFRPRRIPQSKCNCVNILEYMFFCFS